MKLHVVIMQIVLLVVVNLGAVAYGADVAKIGIVDLQRVIDTSNVGKRASERIKEQGRRMEQTLKEKEAELEELEQTLDQKAVVLSQETLKEKKRELRSKTNDFNSLRKRYVERLKEMNVNLSNRIRDEVFSIVEEIGRRGGYQLVLERQIGGVIYAPTAIDITDKVIEQYNATAASGTDTLKTD
jgi:outer membrane protein